MKTFISIFTISLLIAVTAMAAPQNKTQDCFVKQVSSRADGFEMDQAQLQCGKQIKSAFVFSETQMMLLEMAQKKSRMIQVSFENMGRKRLAITDINF